MDNKATTKRMIGAVVLVLVAALLLAWLLKGKNRDGQQQLASNQTAEQGVIKGFPGVGGDEKPALVGEQDGEAAQQQDGGAGDGSAQQQAAAGNKDGGGLMPNINMPDTKQNTTGFEVRPGGEKRQVVDTDGKVVTGEGNMGTGDAKAAQNQKDAGSQQVGSPVQDKKAGSGSTGSASSSQRQASSGGPAATDKKSSGSSSRVVLVNERAVPPAQSSGSAAAATKQAAADKAAQVKVQAEANKRAAAEKAAAAKSVELASPGGSGSGGYSIQVVATSSKSKADSIAAPISADGYKVSVSPANVGGKTVYRVKVAGYPNRAAAEAAQAKMKARYTQNQYVQNSFVTSK